MPSQLINNSNIAFICGRDFLWEGHQYKMGDEFDQDIATGRIDLLVRTRRIYPVVEKNEDRPRHWHHHVHLREVLEKKLGITRDLDQSSIATRAPQGFEEPTVQSYEALTPWEETEDNGAALKAKAVEAYETARVLAAQDREETEEEKGVVGETEPEELILDEEHATKDTDERVAEVNDEAKEHEERIDALYDPAEHSVNDVLEYLTSDISEEEHDRVLASERANKNRKGIVNA